jgi:heterodisulfide reductase subunit A
MVDVARHPNIELLTYSEVTDIDGYVGNFKVNVKKKPRYVDMSKCTGCGECTKNCPIDVADIFNLEMGKRKAIYIPFPQAVPQKYTIDKIGLPPCIDACPAHVHVQGYIALIAQGKFKEALEIIREANPFPAICGRICTHLCEDNCNRIDIDEAVAVNPLKRFISDWEMKNLDKLTPEEEVRPEDDGIERPDAKVAIVGAGPGGLTAGYFLAKMGYKSTVFEALPVTGGMLRVGIPKYRLPDEIMDYEIERIKDAGVEIKTNTPVGPELTFDTLRKQGFKAFFISTGLHKSRKMKVEGEDLKGAMHGLDFLNKVKAGEHFDFKDKVVAIVGGGNVAMDSARTALRFGAKKVIVVYRRSKKEMPAIKEEIDAAEEENIEFHFLTTPVKLIGDSNDTVKEIECIKMELGEPDESGRRRPVPIEGSEFKMDIDRLIIAIGQQSSEQIHDASEGQLETEWGQITVNDLTLQTNLEDVFAGGDVIGGSGIAIQAIADGREAAISIDRYLRGEDLEEGRIKREPIVAPTPDWEEFHKVPREKVQELPVEQRVNNFEEVVLGLTEEQAIQEAKRCLQCNICSLCNQCVDACEPKAIDHDMVVEEVELDIGAIVIATGFDMFDPAALPEYGYGNSNKVMTGLEFERLVSSSGPTEGHIEIDGKAPRDVVFIQCVGSRDREGHEYCSRVCCMYTAKHAHLVKEKVPGANVTIYFTDMRAFGKGFEEFYNRVMDEGAVYRRRELDDPIEVVKDGEKTVVKAKGHPDIETDLVVLATAVVPRKDAPENARVFNISQSGDGFFLEAHPKLRPVDTFTEGVFLAGCAQSPKDIPDTVAQASGAAARVCDILSKDEMEIEPMISFVEEAQCRGCGFCVEVCPYDAIELEQVNQFGHLVSVAQVNEALCKGCGACSAACLSGAIQVKGFTDGQIFAAIGALGGSA